MRHRTLLGALLTGLLVLPLHASAQTSTELEQELDGARQEASELSGELDRVRDEREAAERELAEIGARLADAQGRLDQAEGQVALAEDALVDAEEVRDAAVEDHERAEAQLERAAEELREEQETLSEQVVDGFKYGTTGAARGAMLLDAMRRAEDPNGFAVSMKQLGTILDLQESTVERVTELREDREDREEDAARARSRASQAANDAQETLQLVEDLREQARGLAAEVAAEREAQESAVEALRTDEADTEAMLERAASQQEALEVELREQREAEARRERERQRRASASGSSSGGSSGRGAGGGPPVSGGYCPVQGAGVGRDFTNDWGFPRSGGRSHQGNDMFARKGTPVIAIGDGTVTRMNPESRPTGLGGVTVTYRTGDGSEWYNAHLDTIAAGVSVGSRVAAGQQIGTVGNSGNARTTPPHLHLGRRHGGGWVNPYPTISQLCR